MNELMQYVAQIVKPVSAVDSRKLRMRTDLLAHLEAAAEEELRLAPCDEFGAIERAKTRLGDPVELTEKLQASVPWVERRLLSRLPIPDRAERLERQMSCVPGQRGAMTMGHKTVLSLVSNLTFLTLCIDIENAFARTEPQLTHPALAVIGIPLGGMVMMLMACRLIFSLAGGDWDWLLMLRSAGAIIATQLGMANFVTFAIANRYATIWEMMVSGVSSAAILGMSMGLARYIGVLRRPYDEWLELETAE